MVNPMGTATQSIPIPNRINSNKLGNSTDSNMAQVLEILGVFAIEEIIDVISVAPSRGALRTPSVDLALP